MANLSKIGFRFLQALLLLLLAAFVYVAASLFVSPENALRSRQVRNTVLSALDQVNSVEIVEHSSPMSAPLDLEHPYREVTYATVTLSPKQIDALREALSPSLDFQAGHLMCVFEEHHRIDIKRKDGTTASLHLCFHCGQLYLSESTGANWLYEGRMPPAWPASLRTFFSSLGLHPDGPWPDPAPAK